MKQYTENVLEASDNEFVCWCAQVSAGAIRAAVSNGAKTLDDVRTMTGACIKGDCKNNNPRGRCCSVEIIKFLPQKDIVPSARCSCCTNKHE
ncbi:(2Fe-2S)-binding protein [Bilophila wadsworthia]|uniref:(2Fe-2S)-binding protein n=1 Tax=Bilophila wadsworthia TaxID=35833 RepID=UPI002563B045|nr:(2Fe-2S)-binding protein [Desulfovibrio sp. OttesenSCG-928-C14]MDL2315537.1 (2Fe-2S)-binding protein [Desulfovibrio sp. OttesenSCG-928-A18]